MSIQCGEIVWINGPYEAGLCPDIKIFNQDLRFYLEEFERVEADQGYKASDPEFVKAPYGSLRPKESEKVKGVVRARHETVNKKFKRCNILSNVYRHDIANHNFLFRSIDVIKLLSISLGEGLFSVDYNKLNI